MLRFFKIVLATIVGMFLFSIISFFITIGIFSAFTADRVESIDPNSILHLKLNRPILERGSEDPLEALPFPGGGVKSVGLVELKEAIAHAKNDENIKGIFMEPFMVQAGYAVLDEIRNALIDFRRESGKFVISYAEAYAESDYYLASASDSIYIHPLGLVEFNGLVSESMFFKGTLDKLGIEPQLFRVGEYKSAAEPFIRTNNSEENRRQISSFVNSIYDHYLLKVSEARDIAVGELRKISDQMLVRNSSDAVRYNLVNASRYIDEVQADMMRKVGVDREKDLKLVSLGRYRKSFTPGASGSGRNRIAVIVASGNIVDGDGDGSSIGGNKFAEEIRKARLDNNVKAVVLRVNSPGGSAVASDVIWREVYLTKQVKPIIASMSDLAASGGYYISMACDTIVAQPNTITGSIGVFGIIFNVKNFLNDKIGITTDVVKTGNYSDLLTMTRPLTEVEKQIIQNQVDEIYDVFTTKAAEGRNMEVDQLVRYAGGRVWSGTEAHERGLVDVLGGLEEAIEIAAYKAGITDYRLRYFPKKKTILEQFLDDMQRDIEVKVMKTKLGEYYYYTEKLKELDQYKGIQAIMPYEIKIK